MSDIHALSGAYAVNALDDLERAQFNRHLAECATCRAEVDSLREASALLAETTPVVAPDSLRDAVLSDIARVRPLPPTVPSPATTRRAPRGRALLVAAAAVIAVGGGGVVWNQTHDTTSQSPRQLSAAERVLQAPDVESYSKRLQDGGTVTVMRSKSLNQAVLTTEDLAPAPAGSTYELWLQHDNVMIPAGFLKDGADHEMVLEGDAASAQGAGVTVEPVGGSTNPSDKIVALFDFKSV